MSHNPEKVAEAAHKWHLVSRKEAETLINRGDVMNPAGFLAIAEDILSKYLEKILDECGAPEISKKILEQILFLSILHNTKPDEFFIGRSAEEQREIWEFEVSQAIMGYFKMIETLQHLDFKADPEGLRKDGGE